MQQRRAHPGEKRTLDNFSFWATSSSGPLFPVLVKSSHYDVNGCCCKTSADCHTPHWTMTLQRVVWKGFENLKREIG